jgi:hypothetical protein
MPGAGRGAPLRVRRPAPGSPTRDPSCAVPWWVSLRSVANGRSGAATRRALLGRAGCRQYGGVGKGLAEDRGRGSRPTARGHRAGPGTTSPVADRSPSGPYGSAGRGVKRLRRVAPGAGSGEHLMPGSKPTEFDIRARWEFYAQKYHRRPEWLEKGLHPFRGFARNGWPLRGSFWSTPHGHRRRAANGKGHCTTTTPTLSLPKGSDTPHIDVRRRG